MGKKCMPGVICFENVTIVFIILILFISGYYIVKTTQRHQYMQHNNVGMMGNVGMMMGNVGNANRGFVFNNSYLMPTRQNDTLLDPYNPPLRDNSYFLGGGDIRGSIPINIPTQSPPIAMMMGANNMEYRQIGILTRANGSEMILPLMGQPLYTNRDKWNYYTMSDKNNIVKLPIIHRGKSCMSEYGCDSLNSGDHVIVEGYNDKFKVTVYDNRLSRYIPF
jgi:hypothetical protein